MWQTIGQDHLLRQLSGSLQSGRLGHAYLLAGPPHVGKMTLALDLAAAVNCRQPDDSAGPCWQCDPCSRIRRGVTRRSERGGCGRGRAGANPDQHRADTGGGEFPVGHAGRRRVESHRAGRGRNAVGGAGRIGQRPAQDAGRAAGASPAAAPDHGGTGHPAHHTVALPAAGLEADVRRRAGGLPDVATGR